MVIKPLVLMVQTQLSIQIQQLVEVEEQVMVLMLVLEVQVEKGQSLNTVFNALEAGNIQVVSMRNKANRLEEMFVSLIKSSEAVE